MEEPVVNFNDMTLQEKAKAQASYRKELNELNDWLDTYHKYGTTLDRITVRSNTKGSLNGNLAIDECSFPKLFSTLEHLIPMEVQNRINTLQHWIDLLENG
jgi:hypothetical protein